MRNLLAIKVTSMTNLYINISVTAFPILDLTYSIQKNETTSLL